jgi:hypothetical protein
VAAPLIDLVDDAKFWPMLQSLVDCMCTSLAEAKGPALCYCGLYVGDTQPPLGVMDCSGQACGIAWVRPVSSYPSSAFPAAEEGTLASCSAPLAMQVEIGVARCMPRPTGKQVLADPQEMFDAARLYMSDLQAVRKAIACCFGDLRKDPAKRSWQHSLAEWQPVPSGAGVSGGMWNLFIG